MSLRIRSQTAPPRGGLWRLTHKVSGAQFSSPNLARVKQLFWRHEQANDYEPTTEAALTEQLCANHPDSCEEDIPWVAKVQHFAGEMVSWAKSGFALASEEVLKGRLKICEACPYWRGVRSRKFVFGRCTKCGCRGIKLALGSSVCPIGKW